MKMTADYTSKLYKSLVMDWSICLNYKKLNFYQKNIKIMNMETLTSIFSWNFQSWE